MRRIVFIAALFLFFTALGAAQSTTTNLGIAKPQAGQAQPNVTIATGFDSFDSAVAGRLSKSVAGGSNVTLTAAEARNAILEFTGVLTGSINVIVPSSNKTMLVYNNTTGAFTLTVKTSGGTGIAVTQGNRVWLYCDATNVVELSVSGSGANNTLSNLSTTNINTDLLLQATFSVGSALKPPRYLFLYGGGTYGTHSIRLGGTPTGNRQIAFPDADTNLIGDDTAQTVSNKTFNNTNSFSGYYNMTRITAPSNPSSGSLRLYADNGTGKLACLDSSGADCMPSGGGGSGTVNTGAQYKIAYYPSAGTTVDDLTNWTSDAQGAFTLAPTAASSGNPASFTVTVPANTAVTAGADNTVINLNMSATQQHATGSVTINRSLLVQAPTLSAVGASTITDAITFDMNTPTAGTNVTITRATGMRITGTNNADHLLWLNHKISSTGDVLAMGITGTKIVRFISNGGTINNVLAANGALASNATDGFTWVGEYSGTGAPTGTPTSYTGAEPMVFQRDNINAVYDFWTYSNSAWRSIGGQYKRYDTGSGNGAQTIDFNSSSSANVTRIFTLSGGNATFTFSNPPPAGSLITIQVVQDGTGSRTATWPGSVVWSATNGGTPTLTTTASKRDIFVFIWNGSNYHEVSRAMNL